jgi:hypothetical protein
MKPIFCSYKIAIVFLCLSLSSCSGEYYGYEDQDFYEEKSITSDNWVCTDDCSGHEAGYEWAEENGITDPWDCGGNSNSFIEGCEAYANEHQEEHNEYLDYEDEYYDYPY